MKHPNQRRPKASGSQPIFGRDLETGALLGYDPDFYPFHTLVCGESGSGKSALAEQLYTTAHEALDGPVIVLDAKDDGLPEHIIESVATRQSTVDPDDVLYFNANDYVPATNPLDIRPALDVGIQRERAVTTVVDDYIELLKLLMGKDRFDQAVRAPTLLRYLLKSQFDPIHGSDVVAHDEFLRLIERVRAGGTVPEVSDSSLANRLGEIRRHNDEHREAVLGGVATRIEHVTQRFELDAMLSHTPTDVDAPQFDFAGILDRDVLVIIDCGGLSDPAIQGVTTVLSQQLWRALKHRSHQLSHTEPGNVILGIEEAASTINSQLLADLLSRGRGHGLSVVASLQYPRQVLDDEDASDRLYRELLNEPGSIISGEVTDDPGLAKGLTSPTYPHKELTRDLGSLPQNRWLFFGPTPHEAPKMETELIATAPLAPGHPESPVDTATYRDAIDTVADRTAAAMGIDPESATVEQLGEATEQPSMPAKTPQTTLWATTRLPGAVRYDPPPNGIVCSTCGALYDPSFQGLRRAVDCHDAFHDVDPEAIPPVDAAVKLTPAEIGETAVTPNQLVFLKTILNARQQAYHPLEYDLVADSMRHLRQYTDLTTRDIKALIDRGLLVDDDVTQQKYYTPTKQARELLNEPYRRGVHHGPNIGDLNESTTHRAMVEALRRYLKATYQDDPDSAVDTVVSYYQPDGIDDVLDVVGLDAAGNVVAAAEAERKNHDANSARDDYKKMAAFDLEAALWVAPNPAQGHEAILEPLTDPFDDDLTPLIDIDPYSHNTAMRDINITAPGLTDIFTFGSLRRTLEDLDVTGTSD